MPSLSSPSLLQLSARIQSESLPGIWSKAVALAREGAVMLGSAASSDELLFKVKSPTEIAARSVQFWPEDDDSFCDCRSPNDPCVHVCAVAAAIKAKTVVENDAGSANSVSQNTAGLRYALALGASGWELTRYQGDAVFSESLISIAAKKSNPQGLLYDQDDLAIDRFLKDGKINLEALETEALKALFKRLEATGSRTSPKVQSKPVLDRFSVRDENGGYRLRLLKDETISARPKSPIAEHADGSLVIRLRANRSSEERERLSADGVFFRSTDARKLHDEIIPELRKTSEVRIDSQTLFSANESEAKIRFQIRSLDSGRVEVTANVFAASTRENHERSLELKSEFALSPSVPRVFQGDEAVRFIDRLTNRSKNETGIEITGDSTQPYASLGALKARMQVLNDRLEFTFESGGKTLPASQVLAAYRSNQNFISLGPEGYARIPNEWLEEFAEIAERWLDHRAPKSKAAAYLDALAIESAETPLVRSDRDFEAFKKCIESKAALPEPQLPERFTAELRPYQKEGVAWIQFLAHHGFGVLLADDMGLGKTVQTLASLRNRNLIVCPTSVLHSWKSQCERFRPDLKINLYHGANRKLDRDADVILTSYGVLRVDCDELSQIEFDCVALDEAHTIKNEDRQVAQAAYRMRGRSRIALTGTPIENRAEELQSLFRFLMPEWNDENRSLDDFRARVKPLILRRLKKDVAKDLPPRTEVVLEIDMSDEERKIYRSIEAASSLTQSVSVLEALLRLRQIACHPGLVPGFETTLSSSKIEFLADRLAESIEGGHACLVFSQWTSLLDRIETALAKRSLRFLRLDGSTSNREEVVNAFQDESGAPILLMSLKAGGVGLTLTRADHVFIVDPWWNPAAEAQAADRAHRIGQTKPVLISKLVSKDTVEDRMILLQQSKIALAEAFLEAREVGSAFTLDELKGLIRVQP